ncbi:MAG: glycoside hydrolase family 2 [Sphingobacteriaceae bacterium]|nr:glycoside hydrolase family 2 [Sphingobacteriaceae bacterium]
MNRYSVFGFFLIILFLGVLQKGFAQSTQYQYLSGTDKDHTITWDFYINTGMKSGSWNKIQVPSNWEQQGFGTYNYFTDTNNPEEQGQYKYRFTMPSKDTGKTIFIVFEASMTDTEVKINGKSAGPVHQGGFYRFKYNITKLLNFGGENLLEVTVNKRSANTSVNQAERKADFWLFGGIFRPVYLEKTPSTYIDRIAIDAKADGSLSVNVFAANLSDRNIIKLQVQKLSGEAIGIPVYVNAKSGLEKYTLRQLVKGIVSWNPEAPKLYNLIVSITDSKGVVHQTKQRFGFRTVEMRPQDGFYVNNKRVIFKGVNRHSHWPESGRATSKELSLMDVKLIKEMNMNAVRMSHYPPDQHFLDVCDSLGLFVIDELTGWQAKYDTIVGKKLVKELVERDVNHPSVVLWANGNEGGWNTALDTEFDLYDPQKRFVFHPWEKFNGTDTKHYPDYNYVVNSVLYGKEIFFPTEFMHGLQDGGHAAGLSDFWSLMLKHPYTAGGFLWAFHDEGAARTDKDGKIDIAGNSAPDGILGPHREKEASFFAIREIWSPISISQKSIPEKFNGKLDIENHYTYTNLSTCTFQWKLVSLPFPGTTATLRTTAAGKVNAISLPPGSKGTLSLNLPVNWYTNDVLYLTAFGPDNREVYTWSWPVKSPESLLEKIPVDKASSKAGVSEQDSSLVITSNGTQYHFARNTGYLQKVITPKSEVSLSGGAVLAGVKHTLQSLKHYSRGEEYIVEPVYKGPSKFIVKWVFKLGKPVELEYQYTMPGESDFTGISFNYPESLIIGMKWQGRGPYRVWKNRLEGQQFGVWHKYYNNTITGESWDYPEFKGYHADVYWVTIENKQAHFTVYTSRQNMFFQMLRPLKAAGASNNNTAPPFPEGNIGFLHAISPIGTKFQAADRMGPQSQKNIQLNYTPISGSLWFDFK